MPTNVPPYWKFPETIPSQNSNYIGTEFSYTIDYDDYVEELDGDTVTCALDAATDSGVSLVHNSMAGTLEFTISPYNAIWVDV